MYHVALRIVKSQPLAYDVLQEGFVKVFKNMESFREDSTLGAWIKRIIINESLRLLEKEQKFTELKVVHIKEESDDELFDETETEEVLKAVKKALTNLPTGARTIFTLFYFEGLDTAEISEICEVSKSTVKSQLNYGRNLIRKSLNKKHAS